MKINVKVIIPKIITTLFVISTSCQRLDIYNEQLQSKNFQEIIIKRKANFLSQDYKVKINSSNYVKNINKLGIDVIKVPDNKNIYEYIKELSNDPSVEYAEPNYIRKIMLYEGDLNKNDNDKYSKISSNLNIFKSIFNDPDIDLQYGLNVVKANLAWQITTGTPQINIAVIDTGVDLNHPDLKDNLTRGYTSVRGVATPIDDNGHGTHVSGIIASIANNERGGVGLSPKCKIMPIKALTGKGEGNDSDIAEAIIWAVDNGANIINLSLGGPNAGKTLENAIKYAYNSNVLVVAAMGNNGQRVKNYPASYKNVIAVSATDANNKSASFSNYGDWVSVAAPGLRIYSTFPTYKVELSRFNLPLGYASMSGTSMATPFVSALAGLILSKEPNLKRADIRRKIETGANDIDKNGYDEFFGYGIIDAYKSLTIN
ncbi:MAG: thermitase [Candidatus Sericytochromatia bacterium]|nr:MAG: thermitase [Candidatus Sericytochromatia bacterium]